MRGSASIPLANRTAFRWLAGLLLLATILVVKPVVAAEPPLRIALTAAAVRDEMPFYDRWATYLGRKLGRPVEFVQRRSYRDIIEMLRASELDFAWVCSYSFVQALDDGLVDLVAAPLFRGRPLYQSYIIVPRDSAATSLLDLEGKTFAYTDPDSNTGYIVPRAMLRTGGRVPEKHFRTVFFTWDHGQAIEAVADKVADGAAVDSYVWEYMAANRPRIAERTKVIQRSEEYGFPPMVARRGIALEIHRRFADAVLGMAADPEGKVLLTQMMLDGFTPVAASQYDKVRALQPPRPVK